MASARRQIVLTILELQLQREKNTDVRFTAMLRFAAETFEAGPLPTCTQKRSGVKPCTTSVRICAGWPRLPGNRFKSSLELGIIGDISGGGQTRRHRHTARLVRLPRRCHS